MQAAYKVPNALEEPALSQSDVVFATAFHHVFYGGAVNGAAALLEDRAQKLSCRLPLSQVDFSWGGQNSDVA
jgi:hypothetical protein